jgi:hypothetical protein
MELLYWSATNQAQTSHLANSPDELLWNLDQRDIPARSSATSHVIGLKFDKIFTNVFLGVVNGLLQNLVEWTGLFTSRYSRDVHPSGCARTRSVLVVFARIRSLRLEQWFSSNHPLRRSHKKSPPLASFFYDYGGGWSHYRTSLCGFPQIWELFFNHSQTQRDLRFAEG